jgi:membrane fusion protein, heavy metal efflux system
MIPRLRGLAAGVTGHVPTVLSLLFLCGVAVWGASYRWQAPPLSSSWRGSAATDADASDAPGAIAVREEPAPAFLGGCGWQAAFPHGARRIVFASEDSIRKVGLRTVVAEEEAVTDYVSANGVIDYDPTTYAHIATRAPGTVWWVGKQIGEPTRRGEVLALVESAEVGKAKADFLANLSEYDLRRKVLERLQQAGIAVAERTLRESETAVQQYRIRLFSDQQTLLNFGLAVRIEDLLKQSDVARVRELRLLGLPPDLKQAPEADTLTANLLPIAAPFDGQIVQRNAAIGEAVTALKPLFIVADLRQVHLEMAVDPADVGRLRVGQSVTFSLRVAGIAPATGRLAHIGPEVDEKTRKVWVHAEAENVDGRLRPHSFGDGRIVVREQRRGVVVPADAIQIDGPNHLVFVRAAQAGEFQARHVRSGLRSGNRVEVTGVLPGEQVVTTGSHALLSEIRKDQLGESD